MSLNQAKYKTQIENYFAGNLSNDEKNALERAALNDPMLKDAMDAFADSPDSIDYFNTNLKKKYYSNWKTPLLSVAIIGIILSAYILLFPFIEPDIKSEISNSIVITEKNITGEPIVKTIDLIPNEIEKLFEIDDQEQIKSKTLVHTFIDNKAYPSQTQVKQEYENIDINYSEIDLIDESESAVKNTVEMNHKKYPYTYFYDLAVVDYTRYDNREKVIQKKVYELSGVDAARESDSSNTDQHLIERIIDISYMDYLKESVGYFSRKKYKLALKQVKIIQSQYKDDINAHFYGGLSYFNLGDYQSAINEFNAILQLNEAPFFEEASWFKVKSLLKLNQLEEAKLLIEDIIAYNGFYTTQAIDLLKKLI